jgi:hypothetical protein
MGWLVGRGDKKGNVGREEFGGLLSLLFVVAWGDDGWSLTI